eukprot:GFKZ01002388.1.p1 GENE.GFKZ01002388.1~~GFKZ01002388.1.p1  ORF type:complete len:809 (-),score=110.08 GFKZ01002388.1:420-2765(-)
MPPTTRLPTLDLSALLSVCIEAAHRASTVIREVQAARVDGTPLSATYKDLSDPRSALTVADLRAQAVIVPFIRRHFPELAIIGEEDEAEMPPAEDLPTFEPFEVSEVGVVVPEWLRYPVLDDVCVFCDPLDATRQFVEQRLHAVQSLIGITVRGEPVAGVMARPFEQREVLYGVVGGGVRNVRPWATEGKGEREGLALACSRSGVESVVEKVVAVVEPAEVVFEGGAGNKVHLVLSGRVDVCVLNLATSLWDTAATAALVRASGGVVTDLFGNKIPHFESSRVKNVYGVLVSGPNVSRRDGRGRTHAMIAAEVRRAMVVDSLLYPAGLHPSNVPQATDIALDLNGDPISADWLSSRVGHKVNAFSVNEDTAVRYLMSQACRVDLYYADDVVGAPSSVFLKRIVMKDLEHVRLKARTAPHKLERDVKSYQVETAFLNSNACDELRAAGSKIVSALSVESCPAPEGSSPVESKFLLLLEDFRPEDGWTQFGLLDYEKTVASLDTLASLHAFFWNYRSEDGHEDLDSLVWDQATYWVPKRQAADSFEKLPQCWEQHKANFAQSLHEFGLNVESDHVLNSLGSELASCAQGIAEQVHGVGLHTRHPHRTIIHGDAKGANFFFRPRGTSEGETQVDSGQVDSAWEVGMIDFQWCGWGHPAVDVAYLLAASVSADVLTFDGEGEEELLRIYHEKFAKYLVRYGKATDAESAGRALEYRELKDMYEKCLLDLSRLVVSYHWDRIKADPNVLKSREDKLGSNSYNKDIRCAMWLVSRTVDLLKAHKKTV